MYLPGAGKGYWCVLIVISNLAPIPQIDFHQPVKGVYSRAIVISNKCSIR